MPSVYARSASRSSEEVTGRVGHASVMDCRMARHGNYRRHTFTPEQDERVREGARKLVEQHGSQRRAAVVVGVSQQTLSKHLDGLPAGWRTAEGVARALGVAVKALVGIDEGERRVLRDIPGWETAEEKAVADRPELEWAIRQVGDIEPPEMPAPERINSDWIADLAYAFSKVLPRPK